LDAGKYDPDKFITVEQVEITIKLIECLSGVLGFLPMVRPHIPNEKRERLLYLMNEKRKQNYEEEKRVKIQVARTELQYLKEHPIKIDIPNHLIENRLREYKDNYDYHKTPYNKRVDYYVVRNSIQMELANKLGIPKKREEHAQRIENIWNQIQRLENSQPSQYTSLPSSITSLKNLDEIKAVAIQVGMPSHEVEEFIEWELNPFTSEEKAALIQYISFFSKLSQQLKNDDDAISKFRDENQKVVNQLADTTTNRRHISTMSSETRYVRTIWQFGELSAFTSLFIGNTLDEDPIKIPSGRYVETLRVERTQQDLNNEMANELSNLPRYQAYVKLIDESGGKQIVRTHRMQTHPLPAITDPNGEVQALTNGHSLCKTRIDIEAEIRERQSRWNRGSGPPRGREREKVC